MNDGTLQAVLDEDLEGLLESLDELKKIRSGSVFCQQCGTPITLQNLQLIIPMGKGRFEYVCNGIDCVESYYQKGGER